MSAIFYFVFEKFFFCFTYNCLATDSQQKNPLVASRDFRRRERNERSSYKLTYNFCFFLLPVFSDWGNIFIKNNSIMEQEEKILGHLFLSLFYTLFYFFQPGGKSSSIVIFFALCVSVKFILKVMGKFFFFIAFQVQWKRSKFCCYHQFTGISFLNLKNSI